MDTGDLRLVETLIRDAVEGIRAEYEGRLGLSEADVSGLIYSHLEGIWPRIEALEAAPVEVIEIPEFEEPSTAPEIIAAEAEAEVAIIEAEAEAEATIIEALAENGVTIEIPVEENPLEETLETVEEMPEMIAIVGGPEGEEPAPRRGGFWNSPILGGRR